MDISNTRRSILIVSGIIITVVILLLLVTFIMIKSNNLDFRTPVIVRKNPTVTYIMGEVEYSKSNSSKWKNIEIGSVLKEG